MKKDAKIISFPRQQAIVSMFNNKKMEIRERREEEEQWEKRVEAPAVQMDLEDSVEKEMTAEERLERKSSAIFFERVLEVMMEEDQYQVEEEFTQIGFPNWSLFAKIIEKDCSGNGGT